MRTLLGLLLAIGLLVVSACGGDTDAAPGTGGASQSGGSAEPAVQLDGTTWVAQDITEAGEPFALAGSLRLEFADGSLRASGGCNSMGGAYSLDGDQLKVAPMAATMMACEPALMEQDTWVNQFFEADQITVNREGDQLTLRAADVTIELLNRQIASPDAPLVETTWELTTLVDDTAAASLPAGVTPPTLSINAAGELALMAGCNQGGAMVDITEASLDITELAITDKGCEEEVMQVEKHVLAVLDGTVEYSIQERNLRLTNGNRGLEFTAK